MSKNVNLIKSDISSLFEQLENVSQKQNKKKRKDEIMSKPLHLTSQIFLRD